MISPTLFLILLAVATGTIFAVQLILRRRHQQKLIDLARQWQMHYSPNDLFDLAARVAERLKVPGAAEVRVVDLIYGLEKGCRRYVFSAHYTKGIVRKKHRMCCVAAISESCDAIAGEWSSLVIAPESLPLLEQYQTLGGRQNQ